MKIDVKIMAGLLLLSLIGCTQREEVQKPVEVPLLSEDARFSYAMGMDIGANLKGLAVTIDQEALFDAMKVSLNAGKLRMTKEEAGRVKQMVFKKRQQEALAKRSAKGEANKKVGDVFLTENAKNEDVTVTESGLQYQVLETGKGPKAKITDTVKVHYIGTLLDGSEFDSSVKRNTPAVFPLNAVIPGWGEGLQLMNVGSKYRLFIPSGLAYGERGAGEKIAPNSVLIFDVELLEIVKVEKVKLEKKS